MWSDSLYGFKALSSNSDVLVLPHRSCFIKKSSQIITVERRFPLRQFHRCKTRRIKILNLNLDKLPFSKPVFLGG